MNKKLSYGLWGLVLIIGTFGTYVFFRANKSAPTSLNDSEIISSQAQKSTKDQGSYVDYRADIISTTTGTKVLFFHAPWCSQCRSIESGIKAQGVPEGLTIIKVDYDSNQALRQKYGVTLQTTFVKIDDQGNFISKYVAYEQPTFEAVKENFL